MDDNYGSILGGHFGAEAKSVQKDQPEAHVCGSEGLLRSGGIVATATCLCKAAIGAGVLSMAAHAAEVGLLFTYMALAAGGIFTVASIRMIGQASIATSRWSFEDICEELFGPGLSLVTGLIQTCGCLGSAAAYLIVCGQVFRVLSGASEAWQRSFVVFTGLFIGLPLALARHINFLRYVSVASVCGLILMVVVVIYVVVNRGPDPSVNHASFWYGGSPDRSFRLAFSNQFIVPQLVGELSPRGPAQLSQAAMLSTAGVFFLYGTVSAFGVLAFGVAKGQEDTLVLDLAPMARDYFVVAALVAVMFSTLICFEFQIYPIKQFLSYVVRKARGRVACEEDSDVALLGTSLSRRLDIICAVGAVTSAICIAVALHGVQKLLNVMGASAAAYISFIIPALWVIKLHSSKAEFSQLSGELLLCYVVLLVGLFFFMFGTYAAIVG